MLLAPLGLTGPAEAASAALPSPELSVTTDQPLYEYGASAQVTAHLGADTVNRTVSVYATPYDGERTLLGSGEVDGDGNLTVPAMPDRRTLFEAEFEGDEEYSEETATVEVAVEAGVTNRLRGGYDQSGKYRLYRVKHYPKLAARVRPDKPAECVAITVEVRRSGEWRLRGQLECLELDEESRAAAFLNSDRFDAGDRVRLRTSYGGDEASEASDAPWKFLRFTKSRNGRVDRTAQRSLLISS